MRRLLFVVMMISVLTCGAFGQNKKVTELAADTAPTSDDLIMTANDPAGTPVSKKVTLANLFFAFAPWTACVDAGSTDTYACSLSPAPAAYVTGNHYRFKANTVNTGAATINFNTIGAVTIKKLHDQDLDNGDIEAGQWVELVFDGVHMQMQSQVATAASGGGGGVNPTDTFIPYSNAGTFADSNIKRTSSDLTEVVRSTNAQVWSWYKRSVSPTEYQRLKIDTGATLGVEILADGLNATVPALALRVTGSSNGLQLGTDVFKPSANRSHNLGVSSFLWNQVNAYEFISNNASDTSSGGFRFNGGPHLYRTASGKMELRDPTGAFNLVQFGLGQANVNVSFVKPANVQYIESRNGDNNAYVYHVMAGSKFTSAQFDKTNTTLADVTGLTTEALTAGRTYGFEAVLFVGADATGGSKFAIAGTATATAIKYEIALLDDATSAFTITSRQTALGGSAGQAGTTAGMCRISGMITVNAEGTLTVQFAQNAANGTSSVLTMSNLKVWQMN